MTAPLLADRVMETTTTTGTGTFALAGAVSGYRSFSSGVGNGNACWYVAEAVDANNLPTGDWEAGTGTYTASGSTLSRDSVVSSSTGSAVSFAAGTKRVFVALPATGTVFVYSGDLTLPSATRLAWSTDCFIQRDAANVVAVRNGANATAFYVYNTFTDGSNYERGGLRWNSNILYVGTQAAGTGTARDVAVDGASQVYISTSSTLRWAVGSTGHLVAIADNSYDVGASGANRPRNIFVGSSVVMKTKAGVPTDSDVTGAADGMMVLDTTNNRVYFRAGGAWKYAALT